MEVVSISTCRGKKEGREGRRQALLASSHVLCVLLLLLPPHQYYQGKGAWFVRGRLEKEEEEAKCVSVSHELPSSSSSSKTPPSFLLLPVAG